MMDRQLPKKTPDPVTRPTSPLIALLLLHLPQYVRRRWSDGDAAEISRHEALFGDSPTLPLVSNGKPIRQRDK
jgi:hypothetical protein